MIDSHEFTNFFLGFLVYNFFLLPSHVGEGLGVRFLLSRDKDYFISEIPLLPREDGAGYFTLDILHFTFL